MSSVDVVIPCYKYGRFLRQCAESVLSRVGVKIRVLIIDDASPDNTFEITRELELKDSRITVIRHSVNRGHIATYNEGISWSTADYFLLLSADDYLLPGALSRATALMDIYVEVGFTYSEALELKEGVYQSDIKLPQSRAKFQILTGRQFIETNGSKNVVPTPTAIVRGALQRRVGGYTADLPHSGDMEMWLRLAANASVGRFDVHQAVYRRHDDNMSSAYYFDGCLSDLRHRHAAIESFFLGDGSKLIESSSLKSRIVRSLSCEAIGFASAAFNDDKDNLSQELVTFANEICPSIGRSFPWFKLQAKRLIGLPAWRRMQVFRSSS